MAYTAWSVVYGEQPTAAKWNQLGTNDAGFKDGTNIDALAITMPKISNPYKFSAYRNAAWTTPNNTYGKVTPDVEDFDDNGDFASGRFTATVAGTYHFDGRVGVGAGVILVIACLYKGGVQEAKGSEAVTASNFDGSIVSKDIELAVGEYVELYCYTSAAVAGGVERGTVYFTGHLISV